MLKTIVFIRLIGAYSGVVAPSAVQLCTVFMCTEHYLPFSLSLDNTEFLLLLDVSFKQLELLYFKPSVIVV